MEILDPVVAVDFMFAADSSRSTRHRHLCYKPHCAGSRTLVDIIHGGD